MVMVINVTFNNISVISGRLVLLVEETTNLPQAPDKLYLIMLKRPSYLKCVILAENEKGFQF
jgi:hypothetical protein